MNKKAQSNGIYARYYPINRLSVHDIRQMYQVFQKYYSYTDIDTFLKDLSQKDGLILVRNRAEHRVVGFSTVRSMQMKAGALKGRGIFSGDTILEKAYWGGSAMHLAFYRYLVWQKLRHPFQPVFWMLISKGYKTYLLLANNLQRYYPHPENQDADLGRMVEDYCAELFPGYYDADRKLLDFGEQSQCLKEDVAGVSDELRRKQPKIRFFEQCNPTWQRGTELPCLGMVTTGAIFHFAFKAIRSTFKRSSRPSGVRSTQ
ncbi:MAG: hypothetical protein EA349_09550 [Halomonadaceae bacterium]|nr:MAG: hypothetical protein EA349_09550 [Halomonadaceae bacterium]